jgi:hypothetical protein
MGLMALEGTIYCKLWECLLIFNNLLNIDLMKELKSCNDYFCTLFDSHQYMFRCQLLLLRGNTQAARTVRSHTRPITAPYQDTECMSRMTKF